MLSAELPDLAGLSVQLSVQTEAKADDPPARGFIATETTLNLTRVVLPVPRLGAHSSLIRGVISTHSRVSVHDEAAAQPRRKTRGK